MPFFTFTPSIAPSPGTRHKPRVDLLRADFGDGFSQAAPNGLNHIRYEISLRWSGVAYAQYSELVDFFEARGGHEPFWYQPRGFAEPQKWTCAEWSGVDGSPWTFEAKLVQSFVPSEPYSAVPSAFGGGQWDVIWVD